MLLLALQWAVSMQEPREIAAGFPNSHREHIFWKGRKTPAWALPCSPLTANPVQSTSAFLPLSLLPLSVLFLDGFLLFCPSWSQIYGVKGSSHLSLLRSLHAPPHSASAFFARQLGTLQFPEHPKGMAPEAPGCAGPFLGVGAG